MSTYVLFIFGNFEDHEDIEFFCMEVLGAQESIASLKYVIGNGKNIVVIFDTNKEEQEIAPELSTILNDENIIFYFMFRKNDIVLSHIPESMRNLIFKPSQDFMKIEYSVIEKDEESLILDDILEKIEKNGIDSLTPNEKNFLDNFEK